MSAAAASGGGAAAEGSGAASGRPLTVVRVVFAATAELPDSDTAAVEAILSDAGLRNVTAWPVENFIDAAAAAVPAGRHSKRFEGVVRLALRRTLG